MAKIYVASSWRNPYQPEVVKKLREQGHIYVGNRDHATVLHGIKTIDGRLKVDKELQHHLKELEEKLIGKAL